MATFSGEWIKVRTDLAQDPAVIQLAATLEGVVDEDHAVGKLHKLWSWADRQSRDGHAVGVTFEWVNRYVSVTNFAQTLEKVGWLGHLDHPEGGIYFPNWDQHNGKSAKKRAQDRQRTRNKRERDKELDETQQSGNDVTKVSRNQRDNSVTKKKNKNKNKNNILTPFNPPFQGEEKNGNFGGEKSSEEKRKRKTDAEWKEEPPPAELVAFCQFWNSLHAEGFVTSRVRSPESPSVSLKKTWDRVQDREAGELVANHDALREAIRTSPLCKKDWFRPIKLLSGRTADGQETIINKLLDGGYRENTQPAESQLDELKRLGSF